MNITLAGKRIKLMHLEPSMHNAKLVYDVLIKNKDFLLPWMQWLNGIKSAKDTHNFLIQSDHKWENDSTYEYFIVLNDTIIGACGAVVVDKANKKAELGYWLANDYRGRGYMMDAIDLLERELFKNGFNKIIIHTDVRNKNSINIARKMGYTLEAVLKQDRWLSYENRFRDTNCFVKFKNK
ncbi:GNAT family N-acetyltransferase [bacterium]|nr:GNAT family N-acetyltransferase [bacterium]